MSVARRRSSELGYRQPTAGSFVVDSRPAHVDGMADGEPDAVESPAAPFAFTPTRCARFMLVVAGHAHDEGGLAQAAQGHRLRHELRIPARGSGCVVVDRRDSGYRMDPTTERSSGPRRALNASRGLATEHHAVGPGR